MKSEWISVADLFGGGNAGHVQYKIPLFQRHYVWDNNVWRTLWRDITEKVEANQGLSASSRKRHFTGAIVTQHLDTIEGEVPKYEVIDGQQRLTTFQIILCAIREICKNRYPNIETAADNHIANKDYLLPYDNERYKLLREESRSDESDFLLIVDGKINQCKKGNIREAYRYFFNQIKHEYASDQQQMFALFTSISQDFGVVKIEIDSKDDESEKIFASLNTTGKLLREFDHLRNNLFLRARTSEDDEDSEALRKSLYRDYWSHFEVDDYWITRANDFLRIFLEAKLGPEEVDSTSFDIYQKKYLRKLRKSHGFAEGDPQLVIHEFIELEKYARVYQEEIDNDNLEIGHRMEFYKRFNFSNLHPFLLFIINESKLSENQIDEVFEVLESYTLRRMLCYGQKAARTNVWINKFFNKFFTEESKEFELGELVKHLSESKYDKWPTDTEIEDALGKVGTTPPVARYILYRIECWQRENDRFTEKVTLPPDQFTLEHIMPQSWRDSWPLPIEGGDEKWFGELYTTAYKKANLSTWNEHPQPSGLVKKSYKAAHDLAERRKNLIQSIGNLTIVSGDFNRDGLGNQPFDTKKNLLFQHSDLRLNKTICMNYDSWDADQICDRATRLLNDFRQIWRSADSYIEKITGQVPEPKVKPDWISMLELDNYQIVTCTRGLVDLSAITVTSEFDIMGSYEDDREELLDRLDVIFAYPTTVRDGLNSFIKNLEGQERLPIMNENRQLRLGELIKENQVYVTMKTCSMHLAGTIKKFDDEAIYMQIGGCDVIVFRHSLLEFATDESYDGEVENWGAQDYGFIKCSTNPHKAWQDIYVTTEFLGEGVTSLIPGQKVEFNVKMVLKNGRPRLEA